MINARRLRNEILSGGDMLKGVFLASGLVHLRR